MNYLWGSMILIGIIYGTVTGHLEEVSEAAIQSSKEAVSLCVVNGWGYGTLGGDDADCREVWTSGGDGAENAAGAELSFSGRFPGITRRGNRSQRICWRTSWDSAGRRHRQD